MLHNKAIITTHINPKNRIKPIKQPINDNQKTQIKPQKQRRVSMLR